MRDEAGRQAVAAISRCKLSLVQPDGAGGRSFLVYDNFRALMRWNRSTYFAASVGLLADQIKNGLVRRGMKMTGSAFFTMTTYSGQLMETIASAGKKFLIQTLLSRLQRMVLITRVEIFLRYRDHSKKMSAPFENVGISKASWN